MSEDGVVVKALLSKLTLSRTKFPLFWNTAPNVSEFAFLKVTFEILTFAF